LPLPIFLFARSGQLPSERFLKAFFRKLAEGRIIICLMVIPKTFTTLQVEYALIDKLNACMVKADLSDGCKRKWQGMETLPFLPNRLLKKGHLRRSPHPSPCQARGRPFAAYTCRERFETVPYEGFRLPARSPALRGKGRGALHLTIFEQPEKMTF